MFFKETLNQAGLEFKWIYAFNEFNPETKKSTNFFVYKGGCNKCPCDDKNLLKIEWEKKETEKAIKEIAENLEENLKPFNYAKFFNLKLKYLK